MKILDWYILKRYLFTFLMMLLLFIPIAIMVHLAEKIGKIISNDVPFDEVALYLLNFTIYFANLLFPLFLFLSVIFFTSKLANNTEIVAFLSSGVSFGRFLRPYIIGATLVAIMALFLGMYLAPWASTGYNEFRYKYLSSSRDLQDTKNVFRRITDNDYIYVSSFDPKSKRGQNFTLEHLKDNKLEYKIFANSIQYIEEDSIYKLNGYYKRVYDSLGNVTVEEKRSMNVEFTFDVDDLTPVNYIAETKSYGELVDFIDKEKSRGAPNIGRYEVVKLKKWSLPASVFILTIIAVAVSSKKRRGGMGVNLAIGITVAMIYVFFDKIFGVLAAQSDFSPMVAVWFPNLVFGILALYLLQNAKR
ncbi:LptF/LptG family permease [Winogradskyella litorisediminis]|uniref:LptF/LptG family permease n=1 Tax=Winogradskyella litorisediminis TaxID=1156618 RepID=A0ABW3NB77_9FLAO